MGCTDFAVGLLEFRDTYHSPYHNLLCFGGRVAENSIVCKLYCHSLEGEINSTIVGKLFEIEFTNSNGVEATTTVRFEFAVFSGDQKLLVRQ